MFKKVLLFCILALPIYVSAQNSLTINRKELLDKTWYFVAMKCPDNTAKGGPNHYIKYSYNLMMSASNVNNVNYGTYTKMYHDVRDNPKETGTYSITTDEAGNVLLTLKKSKSDESVTYEVPMVESNHLTLIRADGKETCNIFYAVAP